MDSRRIKILPDYLALVGIAFPLEFRLALQSSLALLKKEFSYKYVKFIGRISGTSNDYHIACGIGIDYILDRNYFYSKDNCVTWNQVPTVSELTMEVGTCGRGNFSGDPSANCETECVPNDAEEIEDGDEWVTIKEEDRLAATIASIMMDGAIVPRGAIIAEPAGMAEENPKFFGLEKIEASQFHSYYHVRDPIFPWDKNITCRADYNIVIDFLDSIAHDLPKGCWCIEIDPTETLAIVRSLYWPGLYGIHVLGTPEFGYLYWGNGRKNWDLPFMILPPPAITRASLKDDEVADYLESDSDDEEFGDELHTLGPIVSTFGDWGKSDKEANRKTVIVMDQRCIIPRKPQN